MGQQFYDRGILCVFVCVASLVLVTLSGENIDSVRDCIDGDDCGNYMDRPLLRMLLVKMNEI